MIILQAIYLILQFNLIAIFAVLIIRMLQKKIYLFSVQQMMLLIKSIIVYLCAPIWFILIYSFYRYNQQIIIPVSNMEDTTKVIMFSNNRINPNLFSEFDFMFWFILVVWLIGVIVSITKLINEKNTIKQLVRLNNEKNELLSTCLSNVQDKLKIKKEIDIFLNPDFLSPCLIRLKKLTIIIPNIYQNEEELTSFIYHEVYHLKGNDLHFLTMIKFLQGIFWFNPIINWLNSYYSSYCEIASDHKVLLSFNDKQKIEYAILLQKALDHALKIKTRFSSLNFINKSQNEIKRRIDYMNNYKKTKRNIIFSTLITTLIIVSFPITTFALGDYTNIAVGNLTNSDLLEKKEIIDWNNEKNEDFYPIETVENPFIKENAISKSTISTRGYNSIDQEISANSSTELFTLSLSSSKAVSVQLSSGSSLSFSVLACKVGASTCKQVNSVSNRISTSMTGFESASYTVYIRNNSTDKSNQVRGFIEDYDK